MDINLDIDFLFFFDTIVTSLFDMLHGDPVKKSEFRREVNENGFDG